MLIRFAIVIAMVLVCAPVSAQTTWHVDQSVSASGDGFPTWSDAVKTLQEALTLAGEGDTILIAQGEYDPGQNINQSFALTSEHKGLVIRGGYRGGAAGPGITDCNLNLVADECDILNGTSLDANHNGIPDECEPPPPCPPDIAPPPAGDGQVNTDDLLVVITSWGACVNPNACPGDIAPPGGNDIVNTDDLLLVIGAWGGCP